MRLKTRDMIMVALFSALMAIGAYIKILLPVIPLSFQTFFCAFSGIILGSKLGALSQIIYVALGLAGAPVFTQGGGLPYVFKPSFGFLIGFIIGAYITGKVSEILKESCFRNSLIAVLSGLVALNLAGLPYMYIILKLYLNRPDTTVMTVLSAGFFPFIIKDLFLCTVVAAAAAAVVPILEKSGLKPA